jgi:hypothetical protein
VPHDSHQRVCDAHAGAWEAEGCLLMLDSKLQGKSEFVKTRKLTDHPNTGATVLAHVTWGSSVPHPMPTTLVQNRKLFGSSAIYHIDVCLRCCALVAFPYSPAASSMLINDCLHQRSDTVDASCILMITAPVHQFTDAE